MEERALIGRHISIAGGIEKAFTRAVEVDATCFQIFSRASRFGSLKQYTNSEIAAYKKAQQETGITFVVAHAPYVINLASAKQEVRESSYAFLHAEMLRAESLNFHAVVLHPGSHGGSGAQVGEQLLAQGLNRLFDELPGSVPLALETMAGQGSTIGSSLESLKKIYELCPNKSRIKFCLDLCHVFAAGYDVQSEAKFGAFLNEFDALLGIENIAVIHCSDSAVPFNAHVDRHAPVGHGKIPLAVFRALVNEPRLVHIPKILETPDQDDSSCYRKEIELMRSFVCK